MPIIIVNTEFSSAEVYTLLSISPQLHRAQIVAIWVMVDSKYCNTPILISHQQLTSMWSSSQALPAQLHQAPLLQSFFTHDLT